MYFIAISICLCSYIISIFRKKSKINCKCFATFLLTNAKKGPWQPIGRGTFRISRTFANTLPPLQSGRVYLWYRQKTFAPRTYRWWTTSGYPCLPFKSRLAVARITRNQAALHPNLHRKCTSCRHSISRTAAQTERDKRRICPILPNIVPDFAFGPTTKKTATTVAVLVYVWRARQREFCSNICCPGTQRSCRTT